MKIYYQHPNTWFGDCMPFGKDDEFYSFTFECPKDRVIFEKSPNWPWPQMNNMGLERLIRLVPGKKYHVQITVDDTIATLYVDGVALNTRMYTNPGEGI